MLTPLDRQRYERQIFFGPLGEEGQERLLAATVVVAGVGALGTAVAEMLARGGIGHLHLVDHDVVELSNLQRQTLYEQTDVGAGSKAEIAAEKLRRINSGVEIVPHVTRVTPENAVELLTGADVVVDAVDNFAAKYALNRSCHDLGLPLVYGALSGSLGVCLAILPGQTPCLACLYGDEPDRGSSETAATAGVIAPIVNIVASLQTAAVLKILLGAEDELPAGLVHFDVWDNEYHVIPLDRLGTCAVCGHPGSS